jgi:hypothetical protein
MHARSRPSSTLGLILALALGAACRDSSAPRARVGPRLIDPAEPGAHYRLVASPGNPLPALINNVVITVEHGREWTWLEAEEVLLRPDSIEKSAASVRVVAPTFDTTAAVWDTSYVGFSEDRYSIFGDSIRICRPLVGGGLTCGTGHWSEAELNFPGARFVRE